MGGICLSAMGTQFISVLTAPRSSLCGYYMSSVMYDHTCAISFSYNEEGSKIVLVYIIPVNISPLQRAADLKINLKSIF